MQLNQIVNVASVPQRSPFRYPRGKTWLIPHIRQWLSPATRQQFHYTPVHPALLVEPFAGGGIVSLTVAAEKLADHVLMVELDNDVAAVWHTILNTDDWVWLNEQIATFQLTYENVMAQLAMTVHTDKEQAFRTVLKNRVNRGGILAPGAGHMKQGEGAKGIRSRWYPHTLEKRIQNIVAIRDHITFMQGDGLSLLKEHINNSRAVFFIDPPYTAVGKKAGSRLYTHSDVDHGELFEMTSRIQGDFLMTYDDTDEIRALARSYHFDLQTVAMKNTHHAKMTELLLGRNLDWLRHTIMQLSLFDTPTA